MGIFDILSTAQKAGVAGIAILVVVAFGVLKYSYSSQIEELTERNNTLMVQNIQLQSNNKTLEESISKQNEKITEAADISNKYQIKIDDINNDIIKSNKDILNYQIINKIPEEAQTAEDYLLWLKTETVKRLNQ